MNIEMIQTGYTWVSNALVDRDFYKKSSVFFRFFPKSTDRVRLPVLCYYVAVGDHHVLIDSGWGKMAITNPQKHLSAYGRFTYRPEITAEETAAIQLGGKPLDGILLTHMDCDCVSGLRDFPDTENYISKEEFMYGTRWPFRYCFHRPSVRIPFIFLQCDDDPNAPFGKSEDVFEDGSVIAYLAPGHSVGSVIYKIVDGNTFALFVGDNGFSSQSWDEGKLPGLLYKEKNMTMCLQWIREESKKPGCVGVYCTHAPASGVQAEMA